MQKLTNKEEDIMHILWKFEKASVKEVMEEILNNIKKKSMPFFLIFNLKTAYVPPSCENK